MSDEVAIAVAVILCIGMSCQGTKIANAVKDSVTVNVNDKPVKVERE